MSATGCGESQLPGDLCTGGCQLLERTVAVLGGDGARRVTVHDDGEPEPDRIERRVLHAVVQREACDVQATDPAGAQKRFERGVLEGGVPVERRRLSLVDNLIDRAAFELWMELSPRRATHAVDGPRTSLRHERPVLGWMPVTGRDDE